MKITTYTLADAFACLRSTGRRNTTTVLGVYTRHVRNPKSIGLDFSRGPLFGTVRINSTVCEVDSINAGASADQVLALAVRRPDK